MQRELHVEPGQPEFWFLSNKHLGYLEKAIGNRTWIISGTLEGRKTIYLLHGYYKVKDVKPIADYFDWSVYGLKPKILKTPIEISDFDWFLRLKKEQNNFSMGLDEIKDTEIIAALENTMNMPAKKLSANSDSRRKINGVRNN
jgi:hypothetical protein